MAVKLHREVDRAIRGDGWEYQGQDGGNHYVWYKEGVGPIRIPLTPGADVDTWKKRARTRARAAQRDANNASNAFMRWLFRDVDPHGVKVIETRPALLTDEFLAEHPEHKGARRDVFRQAMNAHERVIKLNSKRGAGLGRYELRGHLVGPPSTNGKGRVVEPDSAPPADLPTSTDDLCGETKTAEAGARLVCTEPKGHDGLHHDRFRRQSWKLNDQDTRAAAAGFAVSRETVEGPENPEEGVVNVTLSTEVADQLRSLLGVAVDTTDREKVEWVIAELKQLRAAQGTILNHVGAMIKHLES